MKNRTIDVLREHLFNQLDLLSDPKANVDLERARMVAEMSQVVINSVKVEVDFAKAVKGAVTLPFIENQPDSTERPYPAPALPRAAAPAPKPEDDAEDVAEDSLSQPRISLMEKALGAGPAADHPWRGLGSRVHRSH